MARDCRDLLATDEGLPVGVHDLLLVRTCLRGHGVCGDVSGDWTSCAALLVLDPDSCTRERLRALRMGFQSGHAEVVPLSHADEIKGVLGFADDCIDLIVSAKGWTAERLSTLTSLFPSTPGLRILMSNQMDVSQGQSRHESPLGWQCVVHDEQEIEAAVAAFQMLACLHAPRTFNCLDHEDIEALFRRDAGVVLVRGTWLGRQLIFTDADLLLLARTMHAVHISDNGSWTEFLESTLIANSIRGLIAPGAEMFSFSSDGFLWRGWREQARTINVLCALSSSISTSPTDNQAYVQ